jgi:putative transposase
VIQTVKQGLEAEGVTVPMTKLCQWFEVPRRSVYYRPTKSAPKVQERFETPIKAMSSRTPPTGTEPWRAS